MKDGNRGFSGRTWRSVGQYAGVAVVLIVAISIGRMLRPSETLTQQAADLTVPSEIDAAIPLYVTYCTKCHGPDGHGDPESIAHLTPPPRDFAGANWRFAKTKSEIQRVIQEGIPGTAMPAMGHMLSADQRALLADLVLQMSESAGGPLRPEFQSQFQKDLAGLGFTVFPDPQLAPAMTLTDAAGQPYEADATIGNVVLVNFWGTTCAHCLVEMPYLARLKEELADEKLTILNVCADEDDPDLVRAAIDGIVPANQIFIDDTGLVTQRYAVGSLPTFVVIDHKGRMVARMSGGMDWSRDSVREAFGQLIRRHRS
jgi:thiol-disulfide isomerase/thioredoxin